MAGDFDASVVIETAQASQSMSALSKEVVALDVVLNRLNKTLKEGQGDLQQTASAITKIVAAQRYASKASGDMAKAAMTESRAQAQAAKEADRHALAQQRLQTEHARTVGATQRVIQATDRKAAADARAAKRSEEAAARALELEDNLSNSRYLLYDVGATYAAMSAGLLAIPAATAAVSAAYEADFAQVIRTNQLVGTESEALASQLRGNLKQMSTDIPVAFGELANIASIAGQLGIAEDQLSSFTDTTARFIAITDVSLDEATKMFGRLNNAFNTDSEGKTLDPEFFNRIGSAIAKTGINAVATESEIAALLGQIGSLSSMAGFSAEQTVGLASALASVRVRPELARGTLTRVFGDINKAVANGGDVLTGYAKVLDKTEEETRQLWHSNPAAMFQEVIKALSDMDKYELEGAFGDIGIKATRDINAIKSLAVNYPVLKKAMDDANLGYAEGTELANQSAIIFDTLKANLVELANAFKNLGDSLGSGTVKFLAEVVGGFTDMVQGVSALIDKHPALEAVINVLMGFGAVVGVLLAVKSAQAFVVAGMVGFQQVLGTKGVASAMTLNGSLKLLAETFLMMGGASRKAAADMVVTNGVMRSMAVGAVAQAGGNMTAAAGSATKFGGAMRGLGSALIGGPLGALILITGALTAVSAGFQTVGDDADAAVERINTALASSQAEALKTAAKELQGDKFDIFDGASFVLMGKTVSELAKDMSLSFTDVTSAITGNEEALKRVQDQMTAYANSAGFKTIQEAKDYAGMDPEKVFASSAIDNMDGKIMSYVNRLGEAGAKTAEVDQVIKELGGESELGPTTEEVEDLTDQLKGLMDMIFAAVDSEAALNAALQSLGESLANSGSFSTFDEGGRANLEAYKQTLNSAAQMYAQMVEQGSITAETAATQYGSYVDQLMAQIEAHGGDTGALATLAANAKSGIQAALNNYGPAEVVVDARIADAVSQLDLIYRTYGTIDSTVLVQEHGAQAAADNVTALQQHVINVTGQPYVAGVNADTSAANSNVQNAGQYAKEVVSDDYTAVVQADTNPLVDGLRNAANWALGVLEDIANAAIGVTNTLSGAFGGFQAAPISMGRVGWGEAPAPQRVATDAGPVKQAPAQVAAPKQAAPALAAPQLAPKIPSGAFKPLEDGYKKAGDAAKGAGDKAKDASDKMKKGAEDAAKAVDDYSQRLGQALQDEYKRTYGLQEATDAYYTQLNSIKKKRQDEINQVKELAAGIKALKAERAADLRTARQMQLASDIAAKYGDTTRSKEYAAEAQGARDAAAEKQRKIGVDQKEHDTIRDGIGKMTGYSQAAIDNRTALRGLESKMLDMIGAYADTGKSTRQVGEYTKTLTGRYKDHIKQAGFNRGDNDKMKASWDKVKGSIGAADGATRRYTDVIKNVPRTVTSKANLNDTQARKDIGGYKGAVGSIPSSRTTGVKLNNRGFKSGVDNTKSWLNGIPSEKWVTVRYGGGVLKTNDRMKDGSPIYRTPGSAQKFFNKGGYVGAFNNGGLIPGTPPTNPRKDNLLATMDGGGFAAIRSGEFIIQQPAVDFWGLDFMDKINNMKMPRFNMGGAVGGGRGGAGSDGPMLVELTAENLKSILSLADRDINLFADAEMLASTTREGERILASKGVS